MRIDNRELNQLRSISFERHYTKHAEGSVLVSFGDPKVLCTASVEAGVPRWLKGKGKGCYRRIRHVAACDQYP